MKIKTLKECFKILDRLGYTIYCDCGYIPYRIEKGHIEKYMNKGDILFYVNYELNKTEIEELNKK